MACTVRILPSAERQLADLPREVRERARAAIRDLAREPRPAPPVGRKLKGAPHRYRLKLSAYRVIYLLDSAAQEVTVTWVGLRRDAYRDA